MTNRFNFERSKILKTLLKVLIFFSGIAILIWQVHGTFETFIKDRTSIATSQKPFDSLVPPTIIFCSRHHQAGGNGISITNISNENHFNEQFIWINRNFNLTIVKAISKQGKKVTRIEKQLELGKNCDDKGNPLVTVEELINPRLGLCYAIIPDVSFSLQIEEYMLLLAKYEKRGKKATVYFTSEDDRHGFLFYDMGRMMPYTVSLDTGDAVGVNLKKLVWKKLQSRGGCKHYTEELSFMKCMLKNQMECFTSGNQTCKCIPENNHKTLFKLFPIQWNVCKTDVEYDCSSLEIFNCYLNKMVTGGCPLPCEIEEYQGHKIYYDLERIDTKSMLMEVKYSTMNIQIHEEYQVQDVYNFIGTVGGSLGLFIGFSYTGFFGSLLDYII